MDETKLSARGKHLFEKMEFDPDERLVYEIRKHPFGLFLVYLTGFFIAFMIFAALVGGSFLMTGDPLESGLNTSTISAIMVGAGVLLSSFAIVMTFIAAYLYTSNVVLITSEKIAQVLYRTIFDRKISQLSIGDVQDVTVNQKGIFARIFNYGTLVIETAGEQQNYTFTFTPFPYDASKSIVFAHEENLKKYGN
jgi:hypothetical protein